MRIFFRLPEEKPLSPGNTGLACLSLGSQNGFFDSLDCFVYCHISTYILLLLESYNILLYYKGSVFNL